jgi:DNA ligase-1
MNESDMMLGKDWDCQSNLTGWALSEKLHGVHGYWDGRCFWLRSGRTLRNVPGRILAAMPRGVHLDGEFFAGYGNFNAASQAVRNGIWTDSVQFVAFDAPQADGDWTQRIRLAKSFYPRIVRHWSCASNQQAVDLMHELCAAGGEGLMAAKPGATYRAGRTSNLRKLKPEFVPNLPSFLRDLRRDNFDFCKQ